MRPRIQAENKFQLDEVVGLSHNGHEYTRLTGFPDLSLWFGRAESLRCNLVVLEVKGPAQVSSAEPQLLCYTSMVRCARQRAARPDCSAAGLASDERDFWFYYLSDTGLWARRTRTHAIREILSILTNMIVRGANLTPATSRKSEGSHFLSEADDDDRGFDFAAGGVDDDRGFDFAAG
ncbi:hypothetical protein N7528_002753 [Penicillium herquei]|nr:hypothetical protein N7528_002753 [Penicillium herquei]